MSEQRQSGTAQNTDLSPFITMMKERAKRGIERTEHYMRLVNEIRAITPGEQMQELTIEAVEVPVVSATELALYLKGKKAVTLNERAFCQLMIECLDVALDLQPAVTGAEIIQKAMLVTDIVGPDTRLQVSLLRKELVAAGKQIGDTLNENVGRVYAWHKAKTARRAELLKPIEAAITRLNLLIADDQNRQAVAAEKERARLQAIADETARKVKAEAERAAQAERLRQQALAEVERQKRLALQKEALKASSAAEEAMIKAAIKAQQETERIAKEMAYQAAERAAAAVAAPVQAEIIERKEVQAVAGVVVCKPTYRGVVTDLSKVPIEYHLANDKAIDAVCRSLGKLAERTFNGGVRVEEVAGGVRTKGR